MPPSARHPDVGQDVGDVMQSWGAEMQELGSTLEVAGDNMGELFEKYGIDESELENWFLSICKGCQLLSSVL